ncbi:MAG: prepilin-type N-terminal cleavage/methylation domain-containing protein [Gammaproteobacteria bacterium]|nr:prepilin-type N-terminal cleavage/methylation domain-containing protein [Gammaproteobacteria bacterium]MCP4981758.1 prepilin-type N-terminal cleavage/methylation domain-containing protein [Gammaproteobacteria bacterium]
MTKYSKGFTLIELMIVVAIIGILTTIAMGWFGDNVIASNRTEARAALSETAGSLEKCKSLYGAYDSVNCTVAVAAVATENNYYTINGALLPSSFTLTATPVAGEPQANDAECTSLTLTNTGVKGGTPVAANECW